MLRENELKKKAYIVITFFGFISLFGDIIYESARSVYGPFTNLLNMDIVLVGLITGIAEFLGYIIRLVSGYLSDKSKNPWLFTFIGYSMLIFVPLIGLINQWQILAIFIVFERIGKAIRSPAKDSILSSSAKVVGTGMGFAIQEFFDQIGAFAGPLIFTLVFVLFKDRSPIFNYKLGFSLLWIPFILLILFLIYTYQKSKDPEIYENYGKNLKNEIEEKKLNQILIIYSIFTFFTTLGFISFILIGYYLKEKNIFDDKTIPFLYSIAMGVDAIFALIIGKIYDTLKNKYKNEAGGLNVLLFIPLFTLIIPFLLFIKNNLFIILSVVLWGIVMGAHETVMKSAIADITHFKKRGLGYGVFNTVYGVSIFLGSAFLGYLIKINYKFAIFFIIFCQLVSISIYFILRRRVNYFNNKI